MPLHVFRSTVLFGVKENNVSTSSKTSSKKTKTTSKAKKTTVVERGLSVEGGGGVVTRRSSLCALNRLGEEGMLDFIKNIARYIGVQCGGKWLKFQQLNRIMNPIEFEKLECRRFARQKYEVDD